MHERIDNIGFGGYRLIQNIDQFCYGVDAVLLASFAEAKKEDRIMDLGTGSGVIPLILYHKSKAQMIAGLEKQESAFQLAQKNVELNALDHVIHFVHGDVLNVKKLFEKSTFSLVVTNPPYMEKGTGPINPACGKKVARHETTAGITDFVQAAHYLLDTKGSFCMVHRPSRLVDIIVACRQNQLEPKRIQFVAPKPGATPNIVLIQCIKNGGKELFVEPTLFVRDQNGQYSAALNRIYERAEI